MELWRTGLCMLVLAAGVSACTMAWAAPAGEGTRFFVAPGGNDAWSGRLEAKNAAGTDGPFATLEAARDAARKAGAGMHRIVVMPGDYLVGKTLELDARDNGLTVEAQETGKATLYGGTPVTGWRRDGDRFWCADLPGVKEGAWDFRALVVNDRLAERARLPETGTFLHQSVFPVRWLSSVGGGWERKPTTEELNTMLYDPKDLPPTLDVRNAEVRIYHMWDESMVGLASNDTAKHLLTFSTPAKSPAGAFNVKKYVVLNTREGMTRPGQWYLDRSAGRVVYWPLPGEEMAKAKVVAPNLECILALSGTREKPVEGITLRGLAFRATTTPLKAGGFGAYAFEPAVRVRIARQCALEGLDVGCVGGQGIAVDQVADCRIEACHIHHVGACGIKSGGTDTLIARNHIHHVGEYYPSAMGVSAYSSAKGDEKGLHLYRNEIHDTPYTGIAGGGANNVIEENLIYRVMREMHDGGAIYGGMRGAILRGNLVRDVVKVGEGYGVSAYYLDEGATDCLVERNVSVGVDRPTHNHIATNITIRDNVFVTDGDMSLSFARSTGCTFENNRLFAGGKVTVAPPNAVKVWKGNVLFRGGVGAGGVPQAFTIDDAMPPVPDPQRRTAPAVAVRVAQPPTLDGEIGSEEWPGTLMGLDRDPSRWSAPGAPAFLELAYDDRCLYVAVNVAAFDVSKMGAGTSWGKDDGAEIALGGKAPDGKPAVFVLRGFAGGALQSVADGGAPAAAVERLGKAARFVGKAHGKTRGGWRGEWAIPFDALGLKPEAGLKLPFNVSVFRAEDGVLRCWEGTLVETWRVDQGGILQLK